MSITESPALEWCMTCCTRHTVRERCPGDLPATGPERHGWRVNVDTPRGIEAYGVLVAPSNQVWRARILTYPNVLWLVPGGRNTIKFVGDSPQAAEATAADFVRRHCLQRKYTIREDVPMIVPGQTDAEADHLAAGFGNSPRKIRFLPVRFGVIKATESGGTGNLSETGMFIITEQPVLTGTDLSIRLALAQRTVIMRGAVVWMRKDHRVGRAPGMGVHLVHPPNAYLDYVRELC